MSERERERERERSSRTRHLPLLELGVDDSVGEALTTDSDALQYTVTLQLMQDQFSVHDTWSTTSLQTIMLSVQDVTVAHTTRYPMNPWLIDWLIHFPNNVVCAPSVSFSSAIGRY